MTTGYRAQLGIYLLYTVVLAFAAIASAQRNTYGVPSHCTCGFSSLPRGKGCRRVGDNECYPSHNQLDIDTECLPQIPDK